MNRARTGLIRAGAAAMAVIALCALAFSTSKKAGDMSNAKQAILAVLMYAGDYDDRAPQARNWMEASAIFVKNDSVFRCMPFQNDPDLYGHAMHKHVAGKRFFDLEQPARKVAILDSVDLEKNAVSLMTDLPDPGRWEGKNVVAFADGHAKAFLSAEPVPFELEPTFDLLVGAGLLAAAAIMSIGVLSSMRIAAYRRNMEIPTDSPE